MKMCIRDRYLSSKSKMFPMTMAVYQFFGKNKSYWNYIFADIVLTCIPVVIVYMIGQKYIVGGMTSVSYTHLERNVL